MSEPVSGLTKDELVKWKQDGYLVLRNAVLQPTIEAVRTAIWRFLEMDANRPDDWYEEATRRRSGIDERGIIPMYHGRALWTCRENPRIYEAFAQLLGCAELLVSIDRVNMNPPVKPGWDYAGFVHWDIDVSARPIGLHLQGLLCLTDTGEGCGGFQCVPGFHRQIESWLDQQTPGYSTRFPDTTGMDLVEVPMKAGDFVIWHGALPHGNTANRGKEPRLAQYITMFRPEQISANERKARIDSYLSGTAPISPFGKAFPQSPRTDTRHRSNELSDLGQRLLGLKPWIQTH